MYDKYYVVFDVDDIVGNLTLFRGYFCKNNLPEVTLKTNASSNLIKTNSTSPVNLSFQPGLDVQ